MTAESAVAANPHILLVLASTREGRFGETVARWIGAVLEQRADLTFELADLRDFDLPYYNQPVPASMLTPEQQPQPWTSTVGRSDGFVIVSPEYNHGYPAPLKSALDCVYHEWNRKPVAFVSYGGWSGGTRAVEQLRQVAVELQMAPVRSGVVLQFARRLFDDGRLNEPERYLAAAGAMLDDLAWWATALKRAREATN